MTPTLPFRLTIASAIIGLSALICYSGPAAHSDTERIKIRCDSVTAEAYRLMDSVLSLEGLPTPIADPSTRFPDTLSRPEALAILNKIQHILPPMETPTPAQIDSAVAALDPRFVNSIMGLLSGTILDNRDKPLDYAAILDTVTAGQQLNAAEENILVNMLGVINATRRMATYFHPETLQK